MTSLQTAIIPYLHPVWKVVGLDADNPSILYSCDNYNLFTSHYFNFGATEEDYKNYYRYVNSCEVKGTDGLYWRFPGDPDNISQDELIGIGFCGWKSGATVFTEKIIGYGDKNWWCFNNSNPGKFDTTFFLGRFLYLKPFLLGCAGRYVNPIRQFLWCLWLFASSYSEKANTNGKLLEYIQIPVMKKYWFCRLIINHWRAKMSKMYGSPKVLFQIYFGSHPLAVYAPEEF